MTLNFNFIGKNTKLKQNNLWFLQNGSWYLIIKRVGTKLGLKTPTNLKQTSS